jgi:YD repeat-containing protein
MDSAEVVAFLAVTQKYSIPEAFAEVESLTSGEWDELQVSDAEGTVYLITYDPESELFTVTDNPGH